MKYLFKILERPILLIFVNSLPESVDANCKCVMYVDDTTLLVSSSDPSILQNYLNLNLNKIANWFQSNNLTLNIKKTKLMFFGTNRARNKFKNISLTYDNMLIERVEKFKYLGVFFDTTLSLNEHVKYLACNVSNRIIVICRVKLSGADPRMVQIGTTPPFDR